MIFFNSKNFKFFSLNILKVFFKKFKKVVTKVVEK